MLRELINIFLKTKEAKINGKPVMLYLFKSEHEYIFYIIFRGLINMKLTINGEVFEVEKKEK